MFEYDVLRVPRLAVDGVDGGEDSGLVSELRVQIRVPKLQSRVTLISVCHLHTPLPLPNKNKRTPKKDHMSFPGGSVIKNPTVSAGAAGDMGLSRGSGKSPGEGNGNLLQYSCLENPMDRGA